MRWHLPPLLQALPGPGQSPHLCAWCGERIGTHGGWLQGEPAIKYGLCRSCLAEQLSQLPKRSSSLPEPFHDALRSEVPPEPLSPLPFR